MRRRSASLALGFALAALGLTGCAGTIQTSTGPRPALEVNAQDAAAEVLAAVTPALQAAIAKHDATPLCESHLDLAPPACDTVDVHAARSLLLTNAARGQRAWRSGLLAWKRSTSGFDARAAFCPLASAMPDFVALAVEWRLLKQADVDKYLPIVQGAIGGVCP